MPNIPTLAEDLAGQVSKEFARLKRSGVDKIDFSQLMMNIISRNGVNDPNSVSYFRKEVARIFARRRAEKRGGQMKLELHSPRQV
jgi:hypothetical protein